MNLSFSKILLIFFFLCAAKYKAQYVDTIPLLTSGTFIAPCGVTSLTISCWGGGGGGGYSLGGGGGSGSASYSVVPTSGGSAFAYTVGMGGIGGTSTSTTGGQGGTTNFGSLVIANGGMGGTTGTPGTGGAGGTTGVGGQTLLGNNGQNGGPFSGGNGGNAPPLGVGGIGGNGGTNSTAPNNNWTPGTYSHLPGAGGGGGYLNSSGGGGAQGLIVVIYNSPPYRIKDSISNLMGQKRCYRRSFNPLSVFTVSTSGIQYQWYSNTSPQYVGALPISGANGNTYLPDSLVTGTTYYFCVASLSTCGSDTSPVSGPIIVAPIPVVDAGLDRDICEGNAQGFTGTVVSGIGLPYTLGWYDSPFLNANQLSNTQTFNTPTNLTPGNYYFFFQAKDTNNCISKRDSVMLKVNPKPIVTVTGGPIQCNGGTDTLFANGAFTYIWQPGNLTASSPIVSANIYTVTGTSSFGCPSNPVTYTLQQPNPLTASPNVTPVSCNSLTDGAISVSVPFGAGTGPYLFSLGGSVYVTNPNFPNLAAGTYLVNVKDANGCTLSAPMNVMISEPAPLLINNPGSAVICSKTALNINYGATGGTAPYTFSWNATDIASITGENTGTINSSIINDYLTNTSTVTQYVNYILNVTDINGCPSTAVTMSVAILAAPAIPTASASSGTVCTGTSVTLTSSASVSNTWINASTLSILSNAQSFLQVETIAGIHYYGVFVTDANSCHSDTSFVAVAFNNCIVPLNSDYEFTYSNTTLSNNLLNNDGNPAGYNVSMAPLYGPTHGSFTTDSAGNYTYTPSLNYSGPDIIAVSVCDTLMNCVSDTIFITVAPLIVNDYYTVSNLISNPQVSGNVLSNDAGTGLGMVTLFYFPMHGTVNLDSAGNFTYFPNNSYCGLDSFKYEVIDTNAYAIHGYCYIDVTCEVHITPTNGFSPNNDGKNDSWVVPGLEGTPNTVSVFDRWGGHIKTFVNYDNKGNSWDGKTANGVELPCGTYFYSIDIPNQKIRKGWVEITK